MKEFIIKCNNREEHTLAIKFLQSQGIEHFNGMKDANEISSMKYETYPNIVVNGTFCGCSEIYGRTSRTPLYDFTTDTIKIIKHILTPNTITIENVGAYKAEVNEENVKVGCQTITHKKVLEIAKAIETIKKNS